MPKIRNKNHPVHMVEDHGAKARSYARSLSNEALDALISEHVQQTDFAEIQNWTRGQKIKFVRRAAMNSFEIKLKAAIRENMEKEARENMEKGENCETN